MGEFRATTYLNQGIDRFQGRPPKVRKLCKMHHEVQKWAERSNHGLILQAERGNPFLKLRWNKRATPLLPTVKPASDRR